MTCSFFLSKLPPPLSKRTSTLFPSTTLFRVRGEGDAGRHRQAQIAHLGEIGPLAAEQFAHVCPALGLAVAEAVDPLRHGPTLNSERSRRDRKSKRLKSSH